MITDSFTTNDQIKVKNPLRKRPLTALKRENKPIEVPDLLCVGASQFDAMSQAK
jgi:hypothetical protein